MPDFNAKMHHNRFRLGLLAGFKGPTSKGREGKGEEGRGGEEKGGEGGEFCPPPLSKFLATPLHMCRESYHFGGNPNHATLRLRLGQGTAKSST